MHRQRLHVIATSRREPDIQKALQHLASFTIDACQALMSDVRTFVDQALEHGSIKRWGAELQSFARQKLIHCEERYKPHHANVLTLAKQASRRFRWTDLQIKRLHTCPTAADFRDALNTVPDSLEETYHRALETIPNTYRKRVRQILLWLTSSLRELRSSEVAAVVAFPFVEVVLRICKRALVTVIDDNTRETIKLAHFTVKEFLIIREGHEEGLHWYQFTAELANRSITAQAIDCVFGDRQADSESLLEYASRYWPAHARQVDRIPKSDGRDELQSRINSLFEVDNREAFSDWIKPRRVYLESDKSLQPLYYASLLGIKRSAIHFWTGCSQLKERDGFYGNALEAAACMGHQEVVQWLVAQIDNPSESFDFPWIMSLLQVNMAGTIRALLERGPKPHIGLEVMDAIVQNNFGEELLNILLLENLATISITEELVVVAGQFRTNPGHIEILVRNFPNEFPVSLRALLAVAGVSSSALKTLIRSRKEDILFTKTDFLHFRGHNCPVTLQIDQSGYAIRQVLDMGMTIPINTELIKILATSSSGSQILKLLLDTNTIEQPLTRQEVLMVAQAFHFKTFYSLLPHKWEGDSLTEDLVRAIAFNCYLQPPTARTALRNLKFPKPFRPTLMQSTMHSRSRALMSLITKTDVRASLTKSIIALIAGCFTKEVMLHLVNELARKSIYGSEASEYDYSRFSYLLRIHAPDTGVPLDILSALERGYKLMSTCPMTLRNHPSEFAIIAKAGADTINLTSTLQSTTLPETLRELKFSTSENDWGDVVYIQPGLQTSAVDNESEHLSIELESEAWEQVWDTFIVIPEMMQHPVFENDSPDDLLSSCYKSSTHRRGEDHGF